MISVDFLPLSRYVMTKQPTCHIRLHFELFFFLNIVTLLISRSPGVVPRGAWYAPKLTQGSGRSVKPAAPQRRYGEQRGFLPGL